MAGGAGPDTVPSPTSLVPAPAPVHLPTRQEETHSGPSAHLSIYLRRLCTPSQPLAGPLGSLRHEGARALPGRAVPRAVDAVQDRPERCAGRGEPCTLLLEPWRAASPWLPRLAGGCALRGRRDACQVVARCAVIVAAGCRKRGIGQQEVLAASESSASVPRVHLNQGHARLHN